MGNSIAKNDGTVEENAYLAPEETPQSSTIWDRMIGFFAWLISPDDVAQASNTDQAYPPPGGVVAAPPHQALLAGRIR